MSTRDDVLALQQRMGESIVGQQRMIERLLLGLLADGHLLVEGLPGLAKTRAIKMLARNLDARLSRIQFTPDLLPADITGSEIYFSEGGKGEFRFQAGPVFANLVLADEVNRSPAKVQAALLEAMEERQVTVGGTTHKLEPLFLVMATQNPIEQEGTYPLPEAQMDRFLMHVSVGYPEAQAEADIVRLARAEEAGGAAAGATAPVRLAPAAIFAARAEIHGIHVSEAVERYIVALVQATRAPKPVDDDLDKWIQVGVSPRGSIGLDKVARAHAWLHGRDFVTPEDVQAVVGDVFRHRLILSYEAHAAGVGADAVIERLVQQVAVA
ncbi:MoxR family ATPase [Cupriavidus taiwanensis]|uniref:AAA family ATPase n=1 Tax=Cupriavidus taiwanensis TaxID=164546 RepID=UPI000E10E7BE|nr:MoxR family ATPase [Cupriavidus taiwanensis]SOY43554.1 putative ATPase, AAA_3 family; MoxR-like ATPase [Cupriavidus taiwanensis]SOY59329.1 putative ATPase, AAA_3 family; MoxR-like ATPase [Cupriavidus taiwanensis]SOY80278.1 putative ATPase, AAA_3 family; MoxR-like ATPase [Cupriavidus taiwanensis]SOZ21186.1 putative ATPase, AAA_3 family; MoxR-like ATPase [Cupriavidus taiwanensis]SOZ51561.1 putative ATPase, AAA_3 family; MoxR-like ATPase [Cupriavidus taiwanensis]